MDNDTIVAISTPPGRGGIGIVRLSGPRAREVAAPMLRLRHPLEPGRARFGELLDLTPVASPTLNAVIPSGEPEHREGDESRDPRICLSTESRVPRDEWRSQNARVLDQIVATFFAAPHSYTGEDVIEIAMHGAPVLLEHVVRQCCAQIPHPARLAEPGEFTQRAFLAGRIDLTQAEAVGDLIESSTLEQARVAARQMGGALARAVAPAKAELVSLIAALEAGIDFAEDDIDAMSAEAIAAKTVAIQGPLAALKRSFAVGRVVREGFTLAIVGRPNAGKSSLFNRLVQRERAIVTASPGTTRDLVTETVAIEGIPVQLIDTAGLREAADEAERIGIDKSREAMADADVVLLVVDATQTNGLTEEDRAVLDRVQESGSAILIAWNKIDLAAGHSTESQATATDAVIPSEGSAAAEVEGPPHLSLRISGEENLDPIPTSALTGEGIDELRSTIVRIVAGDNRGLRESGMLTNLRQHQAIAQALRGLDAAAAAINAATPHEMVLLDLYEALRGLDSLTGATTSEDVLRLIFSSFCIGK